MSILQENVPSMLSMSKDEEIDVGISTIIFGLVSLLFPQLVKAKAIKFLGIRIDRFIFVELGDKNYKIGSFGDFDAV